MPNRLASETSPYLLQHQNNPVDWWPWCPEALALSKREQRPIFLSIGYSACHWCHVMEHESFENPAIAALVNDWFVPIKVDREERPDLDQIYMTAVQLMTGRGGWPMSVFLTPDLQPFFGGTYWPPTDSRGMPGFDRVLRAVNDAWQNRREQAVQQAAQLTEHIRGEESVEPSQRPFSIDLLQAAEVKFERMFDHVWGGFGGAPKFPHSMDLQVLLRTWARRPREAVLQMVRLSLDKMAAGGMYDQLGGGFSRYSVDEKWLIPHFEKMLYDNALLANAYLEMFQVSGEPRHARIVRETLDYVLRDMTDAAGGFHSAEDADSEGEEGKFYVWTPQQVYAALGEERGVRFCWVYDVTDGGNFEHRTSALNLPKTIAQCASLRDLNPAALEAELAESRAKLLAVRSRRVRPGKDDKVLASWNALMIDAMARAGRVLSEPRYVQAAERAARFILDKMRRDDGRLLHVWRAGQAKQDAFLDDYAGLAGAFVTLYETTFDESWIDHALALVDVMLARFRDPSGGFFFTADDAETLIHRNKDLMDNAVPGGNSLAANALLRLSQLTGRADLHDAAIECLRAAQGLLERSPSAAGNMLLALDRALGPSHELVLTADSRSEQGRQAIAMLQQAWAPRATIAVRAESTPTPRSSALDALFVHRPLSPPEPTLYVCEGRTCQAPVVGLPAIAAKLKELAGVSS